MQRWVKFIHRHGQVSDIQTGFHILPGQVKPLPAKIPADSLLARALRENALIDVDPPAGQAKSSAPQPKEPVTEPEEGRHTPPVTEEGYVEGRIGELDTKEVLKADLLEMAEQLKLDVDKNDTKAKIAEAVAKEEFRRLEASEPVPTLPDEEP